MHRNPVTINWDEFVKHSDTLRANNPAYGADISLLLTYTHSVWLRVVALNATLTMLMVVILTSLMVASMAPFVVTILDCTQKAGMYVVSIAILVFLAGGMTYSIVYDVFAKYAAHYFAACDAVTVEYGMHPRFRAILSDLRDLVI